MGEYQNVLFLEAVRMMKSENPAGRGGSDGELLTSTWFNW